MPRRNKKKSTKCSAVKIQIITEGISPSTSVTTASLTTSSSNDNIVNRRAHNSTEVCKNHLDEIQKYCDKIDHIHEADVWLNKSNKKPDKKDSNSRNLPELSEDTRLDLSQITKQDLDAILTWQRECQKYETSNVG